MRCLEVRRRRIPHLGRSRGEVEWSSRRKRNPLGMAHRLNASSTAYQPHGPHPLTPPIHDGRTLRHHPPSTTAAGEATPLPLPASPSMDDALVDQALAMSLAYGDIGLGLPNPDVVDRKGKKPMYSAAATTTTGGVFITCDLCGDPNSLSESYLDMVACTHVLCLACLRPHASRGDGSDVAIPCPVPYCRQGFFLPDHQLSSPQQPTPPRNPPASGHDFYCNICMESKPHSEGFLDINGCSHLFCSDCIAQYVAAKVEDNAVPIPCPDPSCTAGSLEPESCRPIIPHPVFLRWGAALCESSIDGAARFYCPYKDCSALLLNDGDEADGGGSEIRDSECPHCNRRLCAKCRVPWHEGFTCEEYGELGEGERETEDLMLMKVAKKSRWQRCPKCGIFVERVDGCVFIVCRCKHCFCYLCAAPMDAKDHKHYCSKCKCTWDPKN